MRTYSNLGSRNAVTPQSEAIPGSSQVPNSAGGYAWQVDEWTQLQRFLILGTEGGTYYIKERELTKANAQAVERCLKLDGIRTVGMIREISMSGRAPKNEPALFALAMACAADDEFTRAEALLALPDVARTGTHLLHFLSFVEQFRGWGRGLRRAIARWFNDQTPEHLAYEVTKYQSRDKWSMADALRLAHPATTDAVRNAIYKWVVDKEYTFLSGDVSEYFGACGILQDVTNPKVAAQIIRAKRLPREVVPTELLKSADVWDALLQDMPMMAMVRNLATMTRVGLVAPMSDATNKVVDNLSDITALRKSRVHPVQLLIAAMTYNAGKGVRGSNTWTPIPRIVDALNDAFYESFGNLTPSGKRTLLALDVSGSMTGSPYVMGIEGLDPRMASSAMAMVTARIEPQYHIMAFSSGFIPVDISPRMRLDDIVNKTRQMPFEGTDCALPMLWASENNVPVDSFVIYTDSETWAGAIHPTQALRNYRQKTGIAAKLVVVGMVSNGFSIADPEDGGMLDVVGFDSSAPQVIAEFS